MKKLLLLTTILLSLNAYSQTCYTVKTIENKTESIVTLTKKCCGLELLQLVKLLCALTRHAHRLQGYVGQFEMLIRGSMPWRINNMCVRDSAIPGVTAISPVLSWSLTPSFPSSAKAQSSIWAFV